MTAQALSAATGSPIQRKDEAVQRLRDWATPRGFVLTESNLKQCDLPENCEIIENPVGSAVGFYCIHNDCLIVCTPGVPSELKVMLHKHLMPLIGEHGNITTQIDITRLRLFGITESGLQDMVNKEFPDWPDDVDLGFRVQMPVIEVKLTTQGQDRLPLNHYWTEKFESLFSDYIIGRDDTRLSQALNQALRDKGLKIATAESCTGGAIASGITSEAGSSEVFEAGFVVYSNKIKQDVLGVDQNILEQEGAVSEACVRALVDGALQKSAADIAVAISGVAGPGGGSDNKPVGTVWMAWGNDNKKVARKFFLPMNRHAFQRTATAIAMDLVRREILGLPTDVDYFAELKRKQNAAMV